MQPNHSNSCANLLPSTIYFGSSLPYWLKHPWNFWSGLKTSGFSRNVETRNFSGDPVNFNVLKIKLHSS